MRAGDVVTLRGVHDGVVTFAMPHTYSLEHDGRHGLYLALGTSGRFMRRGPDGRYLERWLRPDRHVWTHAHVLASSVRAEGERVIANRPWPTGLEAWRPDPAWPIPELPAGWDRV